MLIGIYLFCMPPIVMHVYARVQGQDYVATLRMCRLRTARFPNPAPRAFPIPQLRSTCRAVHSLHMRRVAALTSLSRDIKMISVKISIE